MNSLNNKIIWVLALLVLVGDFVIVYVLAKFYPGYSHYKQVMSVLGNQNSPGYRIYNIWLIILGIVMIIFGIQFYLQYKNISKIISLIGFMILMFYGIGGCILSGIFSVNETKEIETISAKIHGISAGIGFMVLTFFPLVVGTLLKRTGETFLGNISTVIFCVSLILFMIFVLSEKEQFKETIIGNSGLWQRVLLGSMYIPLIILSIKNIIK